MAAKKDFRPTQAAQQLNGTATPLRQSAQAVKVKGLPRKNGFVFSNNKFVGLAACGSHPPVINIPGFPIPPGLNPRSQRKVEKIARTQGVVPTITASLARAIKLVT